MGKDGKARRMDTKGRKWLALHEYDVIKDAASRGSRKSEVTSLDADRGEAAPLSLLGGIRGIFSENSEKVSRFTTILRSQEHLGRMDAGERKASIGIDWLQGTVPFEKMP
ncbi:hypothetical protein P4E94_19320, partial [Pontiellaceae bacterium B12219]|nr:hypothetical protein [Pontiellaceae bacterium B12219]